MNKSLITNLIAAVIVGVSFVVPSYAEQLFSVGIFALSGAVTNWLAVYMLFERVPLLYGSGVIPSRFEEFKAAIKQLIMDQFFNEDNLKRFISEEEDTITKWFKPEQIIEAIDYDRLFKKLVDAIMESSFGGMLGMLGGAAALDKLKEPFINKIKQSLSEMASGEGFKAALARSIDADTLSQDMSGRIEKIVDQRLEELTPAMVKEIVQEMIRKHLGWLVVWGGVFGGLIGLVVSFL